MKEVLHFFRQGRDYQNVETALKGGIREQLVAGLNGSSRTLFMSALFMDGHQSQLIVTHNLHQAQKIYDDIVEWVGEDYVYLYPVNELISSEISTSSPEFRRQRINVLNQLIQGKNMLVITPLSGLKRILPPPSVWQEAQIRFIPGQDLELETFRKELVYNGYKRVEMVESEGEYSIRGGIIDIFATGHDDPFRIELFDTVIESIRTFDLETQKSKQTLPELVIGPSIESVLFPEHYKYGAEQVSHYLEKQLSKTKDSKVKQLLLEGIGRDIECLQNDMIFQGIYKYISCFYGQRATLTSYFGADDLIFLDEPTRIIEAEDNHLVEETEWKTSLLQVGELLPDLKLSIPFKEWRETVHAPLIYLSLFLRKIPNTNPENIVQFTSKSIQDFHGQFSVLADEVERWKKNCQAILFFASNKQRAKRMERVLNDFGIECRQMKKNEALVERTPLIKVGNINAGFELPLHSLVAITENELFANKQQKKRAQPKSISNAQRIKNYNELATGDYVVHINHGIGQYLGIETLELNGAHKDYLHIKYAKQDKLYVPVEQIDQVQKFVGSEEKAPKLYNLGGNEWKKVKQRVKSSVEDIAENLIKLYAKREATQGYAFSEDSNIHREFESLFPYQETEDQLRTIEEIKNDMEKSRPMDRLLCGDVGYGKTEVAIRAAFKAVMDGKQVAVLVPTTILAQQHYETFRERFHEYAVEIEVLSRFRSQKEQNDVMKNTKKGLVDIVIGTHRLLSKDVKFKDLGLLVVDEEQRFGVSHKEKIKELKENVDVLTLTATPIPRTLHMSMLGVRDLSVIETPPENRFPIQTYVVEYQGALVRETIERELARDGQVYFLYNNVQGIERKAEEIRTLVPDARIAVAHGQMKESELESIMIAFLNGEYDVLVSTTIIETGVDIPNVNTLLIENADRMGLSQLYQLRGRVGRSNRTAYAYFTYQRGKVLSEVAEKRLEAIKEFTELGSGFKIAMRDLAIRGAGNLLGAEQHGFMNSVGFDLYSQLLTDAIQKLKGDSGPEEKMDIEMDVHIDAYIPDEYIGDEKQKINMYKKVAALQSLTEIDELNSELLDRYGLIPNPVVRLLHLARLKLLAMSLNMDSVVFKDNVLKMMFHPSQNDQLDGGQLFDIVSQYGRHAGLISDTQIGISYRTKGLSEDEWLEKVISLGTQLVQGKVVKNEGNSGKEVSKVSEGQRSSQVS